MTASTFAEVRPPTEFIIRPVSGQARIVRNCRKTPLRVCDGPRFHLEANLEEIPVILSDRQYHALLKLSDALSLRMRAQAYRKWRPQVTVAEK